MPSNARPRLQARQGQGSLSSNRSRKFNLFVEASDCSWGIVLTGESDRAPLVNELTMRFTGQRNVNETGDALVTGLHNCVPPNSVHLGDFAPCLRQQYKAPTDTELHWHLFLALAFSFLIIC